MADTDSSSGPRRGAGRLRGRVLRGRPRHAGRAHRRGEEPRRRLSLSRLHPVEGAAARRQGDRRGAARRQLGRDASASRRSTSTSCARFKQGVVDKLTAGVGSVAKLRKVKFVQGRATLTGPTSMTVAGAGGDDRAAVRAPDSRHRLASDEDPVALARQPAHDGLDVRPRAAGRAEVAAGDRRRLHRPRARHRLRDARQQGVGRRDDAGPAARRRSRPRRRAREAAEEAVRRDHAQHQGREGRARRRQRHPRDLRGRRRREGAGLRSRARRHRPPAQLEDSRPRDDAA